MTQPSTYDLIRTWYNGLDLTARLRTTRGAHCSNPNPVMDTDPVTGHTIARCAHCGAHT